MASLLVENEIYIVALKPILQLVENEICIVVPKPISMVLNFWSGWQAGL